MPRNCFFDVAKHFFSYRKNNVPCHNNCFLAGGNKFSVARKKQIMHREKNVLSLLQENIFLASKLISV